MNRFNNFCFLITFCCFILAAIMPARSEPLRGKKLYDQLVTISKTEEGIDFVKNLSLTFNNINWDKAKTEKFEGNLRIISVEKLNTNNKIYLIRKLDGELFILPVPEKTSPLYSDIESLSENKLLFNIKTINGSVGNNEYKLAMLIDRPFQPMFDKIFKISIILMLFFIMLGMGMTLTANNFSLVFKNPKAVIAGIILQFGVMPLVAYGIGTFAGYVKLYPYIYVGLILITVSPGGVTSNLMTHFAKGDLALSISLTSFSTILSLFFTPVLMTLYCVNIQEVLIPTKLVVSTITVFVIIPLIIGMVIKNRWNNFAEKSTPYFSLLGIIAVLFIMIAGVASNLDKFADTARYDLKFYLVLFSITVLGMLTGALIPKIIGVNNYQARAVSLETGLRNSGLAMTLAILLQDKMGDFFSSMFVVSGLFGLEMYVAGLIAILTYKKLLPVEKD